MSQNANQRAIAIMDKVASATGLTEEAKIALIQLVNPFADFEMPKAGYYDTNESSSVVSCVKFSATVAVPANVTSGANWDCHVFSLPFCNASSIGPSPASVAAGAMFSSDLVVANQSVGGVMVMSGKAGAPLNLVNSSNANVGFCSATGLAPAVTQITGGVPVFGSGYLDGQCRVIGMGFEVHNTTSQLNLQGAVATYRLPQPSFLDRVSSDYITVDSPLVPTTAVYNGSGTLQSCYDVPGSLANCMLLNGSRQWEAKEGCMLVPTLNDVNIPAQRLSSVIPVAIGPPVSINLTALGGVSMSGFTAANMGSGNAFNATINPPASYVTAAALPLTHVTNFNTAGAYFTGLSYSTTLTINSIYYIERFPNPNDTNLVVLANPSPPYSAAAMNLYPEMLRFLPVGVKVCDNADGDWFFEAVKSVASFLAKPLGMIPTPMGQAASGFSSAAATWAENKLKERNKPKQIENVAKKAANKAAKKVANQTQQQQRVVIDRGAGAGRMVVPTQRRKGGVQYSQLSQADINRLKKLGVVIAQ